MNNINCVLEEKNKCVGCRACSNICPIKAIVMIEDEEGFFYPQIDTDKCTNCGLCEKSCPALNKSELFIDNTLDPDCYAVMADDEIRAVSSSGGAFTLISNWILEQGGYVCGVAYVGQKVQHIIIDKKEDLERLRGSKYVQSDTNTVYSQIKDLLKAGKLVLFSGTPCQVAGLNTYLGKKYDNLYTVDLICHGVPPQKVFDKYLEETIKTGDFLHASFRDKRAGWNVYSTITTTKDNKYYASYEESSYLQAFIKNMCLRPSCGTCAYATSKREADVTIGDFWAIERYKKELNDSKGTSMLLINNKQGSKLFNQIKNNFKVLEKVPIEYGKFYNITLYTPLEQHPKRNAFFRLFNEGKSLKEITDFCNSNKTEIGILNFWPFPNMGGVIQAWALQNVIKLLGFTNVLLNYQIPFHQEIYKNSFVERFAQKYLDISELYTSNQELLKCNENINTIVVGSDCVWANWWEDYEKDLALPYFANFANFDKKIISYAPSFGNNVFSHFTQLKGIINYYLRRFDSISVREKSGVDILKNVFGLNGTQVLDPTLLINIEKYDEFVKKSKFNNNDYVFNYTIGVRTGDLAYRKMVKKFEKENLFTLDQDDLENIDIEDWLYLIKNSKLLITNSYHACCFAIKFNIPFYIFTPLMLDTTRFDSLLGMLNLEDRILQTEEDVDTIGDLFEPIDWDSVNFILEKEKERSLKWLKDALETPKDITKVSPADAIIQSLNSKIFALEYSNSQKLSTEDVFSILNYKKIYAKYLKYKVLKNFVLGKTRDRYKEKQKIYHGKVRKIRDLNKRFVL